MFRCDDESMTEDVKGGFNGWLTVEELCTNAYTIRYLKNYINLNIQEKDKQKEARAYAIGTRGKGAKMEAHAKISA